MWSSPATVKQALGREPHPESPGHSLLCSHQLRGLLKHIDGFLS